VRLIFVTKLGLGSQGGKPSAPEATIAYEMNAYAKAPRGFFPDETLTILDRTL
jgi:hypothetical protein